VYLEQCALDALDSLPLQPRDAISNVAIVVEEEPPPGQPLFVALPERPAHAAEQLVRQRAAGQDQHLLRARWSAAPGATPSGLRGGQARRPARGRAPLRHQRRAADRNGPLLTKSAMITTERLRLVLLEAADADKMVAVLGD
jgi:hypothetical protein